MPDEWFFSPGDARYGPVSEERLHEMAAAGELKPYHLVWKTGMPEWVEARAIAGLIPPRREAPPPEPPGPRPESQPEEPTFPDWQVEDEVAQDGWSSRRRRKRDDVEIEEPGVRPSDESSQWESPTSLVRPWPVTTCGYLMLAGGIVGLLVSLGWTVVSQGFCCLWPGIYFEIAVSVMLIARAANILTLDTLRPARALAICQVCCIFNWDFLNVIFGVVNILLLTGEETKRYYREKGFEID